MATRTAPTVAVGTANEVISTLHLIDVSGDQYTDAIKTTTTPTEAQIEAWSAAYQAASQASLWKVSFTQGWVGDKDPDNGDVGQRNSVKDGTNLLFKNTTTLMTQTPRQVAPVGATLQGNQDIPLLTSAEMTALITAVAAILTGYDLQSAQFTERRERSNNPRIKA